MACEPQIQADVYEAAHAIAYSQQLTASSDVEFTGTALGFYAWYKSEQWKVLPPQGPNQVVAVTGGGLGAVDFIIVGSAPQLRTGAHLLARIRDLISDFDNNATQHEECLERRPVTVSFDPRDPLGDQFRVRAGSCSLYAHRRSRDRKWSCTPIPLDLSSVTATPGVRDTASAVVAVLRQRMQEHCRGL